MPWDDNNKRKPPNVSEVSNFPREPFVGTLATLKACDESSILLDWECVAAAAKIEDLNKGMLSKDPNVVVPATQKVQGGPRVLLSKEPDIIVLTTQKTQGGLRMLLVKETIQKLSQERGVDECNGNTFAKE